MVNSGAHWMARCLAATLALLSTANLVSAQDLTNGDLESWSRQGVPIPIGWGINNHPADYQRVSDSHSGDYACQVKPAGNWSEIGKQWVFDSITPTEALHARVRIRCTSLSQNATLRVRCEAFLIPVNGQAQVSLPGSTDLTIAPSPHWQEHVVSYTPPAAFKGKTLVRFWVTLQNGISDTYLLDSVDFSGSGALYGRIEPISAKQVISSEMSLIYDSLNATIREIRSLGRSNDQPVAAGPNWLVAGANQSRLFKVSYRQNITDMESMPGIYSDSAGVSLDVEPLTSAGKRGFRVKTATTSVAPGGYADPLGLTIDIYSQSGEPEIYIDPKVERPQSWYLETFHCPELYFDLDRDDDESWDGLKIVSPRAGGALLPADEHFRWDMKDKKARAWYHSSTYPGSAALQLQAIYEEGNWGVCLMTRDESDQEKSFTLHVINREDLSAAYMSIAHRVPSYLATVPQTCLPPLTRVLLPCRGDWRDAGESYRDWARTTQRWADAANRPTASWVSERPVVFEAPVQPLGMGLEVVPLNEWTKVMDAWSEHFSTYGVSGKMLPLFRDFERHGTYMGPFYRPFQVRNNDFTQLHSEQDIQNEWLSLHDAGHHPMTMIAGLRWAKMRTGEVPICSGPWSTPNENAKYDYWSPPYDYATLGLPPGFEVPFVIQNRSGESHYKKPGPLNWEYGYWTMDPRSSKAQQTHASVAEGVAVAGVDLYLFDQWHGLGVPDNFDPQYGVEVGAGTWKVKSGRQLMKMTLETGRRLNTEFEGTAEDPTEGAIDVLAVHGIRPDRIRQHPAPPLGASESIPLFPYVFNEVVSFVTWDQRLPTQWAVDQYASGAFWLRWFVGPLAEQAHLVEMGRILVSGAWMATGLQRWMLRAEVYDLPNNPGEIFKSPTPVLPGNSSPSMNPLPAKVDQKLLKFFDHCVAMSQGKAARYLNTGKMVRAEGLADLGTVFLWLKNVPQPRVHHAAFELGDRHALLLANVEWAAFEQTVTLPARIGSRSLTAGAPFWISTNNGPRVSKTYAPDMTISIKARDVLLLEFYDQDLAAAEGKDISPCVGASVRTNMNPGIVIFLAVMGLAAVLTGLRSRKRRRWWPCSMVVSDTDVYRPAAYPAGVNDPCPAKARSRHLSPGISSGQTWKERLQDDG